MSTTITVSYTQSLQGQTDYFVLNPGQTPNVTVSGSGPASQWKSWTCWFSYDALSDAASLDDDHGGEPGFQFIMLTGLRSGTGDGYYCPYQGGETDIPVKFAVSGPLPVTDNWIQSQLTIAILRAKNPALFK